MVARLVDQGIELVKKLSATLIAMGQGMCGGRGHRRGSPADGGVERLFCTFCEDEVYASSRCTA